MSNKTFPCIDKKFGEFVRVWARDTTQEKIELARSLNCEKYERADVSCGGFSTDDFTKVEAIAAALLEAVAFARAVNKERGVE